MRIALDGRTFTWAGIGRYTRSLTRALLRVAPQHDFVLMVSARDRQAVREALPIKRLEVRSVEGEYYTWREHVIFWQQLQHLGADLYHFTHFNVPLFFGRPYVVTVHDTTRFYFPGQTRQHLARQVLFEYVFRRAVERARGVVCVSHATRQALGELPIALPRREWVVPEAVDDDFRREPGPQLRARARLLLGWHDPFLLYVGVWMSHKNLPRLLAAFRLVLERYPYMRLVLTGRPRPGYVAVDRVARKIGLESDRVLYLGFVPQSLLPGLVAEAAALVMPSLYEGFGLPALEAQALGTPVVASNVTSLPEVLGGAAEFVNPEYVPGIAAGIERIIGNLTRRAQLTTAGKACAARYSWEDSARAMVRVYEAAISP